MTQSRVAFGSNACGAVDWARRVPAAQGDVIEIRQIFEISDFPEDVKKAADNPAVTDLINR